MKEIFRDFFREKTFVMSFFFQKRPSGGVEYIIAGLGNPGKKYERTRHNAGFICLDQMAAELGVEIKRAKYDALTAETVIAGKKVLLMKPQTFMNLSGTSVEKAASFYKVPPEKVIVIFDDISLPPGRMRIRRKGSHGGHNGVRNITDYLQSENFPRLKIGVGQKPRPEYDLADWVLSTFTEEELKGVRECASHCLDAVALILQGEVEKAMALYNS